MSHAAQPDLFGEPATRVDVGGSEGDAGRGPSAAYGKSAVSNAPPCAGSLSIDPDDDDEDTDTDPEEEDEESECAVTKPKRSKKSSKPPPEPAGPRSVAARIVSLAQQGVLTDAERGQLDTLLGREINTASTKQMRSFLYDAPPTGCGFPKRWIKEGARNTDRLSVAVDALLATFRQNRDPRLELCLRLSDLRTQLESLQTKLDRDGRIRFTLNIAGTKVGRMACHASNTGSGYGLHSTQDRHKTLFIADPGHEIYQVDLTGADTWTVAAECLALGDPTMWDDLRAGLKPAKALSALYLDGEAANRLPRPALLVRCKALPKDWLYDAAKKCTHGSNYGEGDVRMAETILRDSWEAGDGTLATVTAAQCKRLQNLYFVRYPGVRRWQERVRMLLQRDGALTAASGLRRDFFGVKTDHSTIKEAYAFCPAANTAHLNNCALLNIWNDPDNLLAPDHRIAKLLLQVHDSVLFQAPLERRDWVKSKIPQWWGTSITVAGTTFTMPYEAQVGPSWSELQLL